MITEIRLENFKSFKELTRIPLKKITVFIGPNGAGKSTPLQALMLLKQSDDLSVYGDESTRLVDPGYPHKLFHNNQGPLFRIGTTVEGEGVSKKIEGNDRFLTFSVDIDVDKNGRFGQSSPDNLEEFRRTQRSLFENFYFIPATRGFEKTQLENAGTWRELSSSANPEDRPGLVASKLASSPALRETVNKWLDRVTGVKIEYSLGPNTTGGGTIQIHAWVSEDETTYIAHEGFGTNQLIHLLLQLAVCPKGSFLAIEEPEAHLHPKAQVALTKLLLERAKEYDLQLVLTTHSEHVLHTLLNQVGKGSFTPKEVGLLYFRKEEGISKVEERVITKRGQVKGGLPGFFEVELEQFSEFVEALSKQK